jgi:hypothetical protein
VGDADNCGEHLHQYAGKQGQRGAKIGLQQGDLTPSSETQGPAPEGHVGREQEAGKGGQHTADLHLQPGRIAAVVL